MPRRRRRSHLNFWTALLQGPSYHASFGSPSIRLLEHSPLALRELNIKLSSEVSHYERSLLLLPRRLEFRLGI